MTEREKVKVWCPVCKKVYTDITYPTDTVVICTRCGKLQWKVDLKIPYIKTK